jgi:putative transposon-encoded protein
MSDRYEIEGEEIVQREVKPFGSGGAHVTAPNDWIGADIKLVRIGEPTPEDDRDV